MAKRRMIVQIIPRVIFKFPSTISAGVRRKEGGRREEGRKGKKREEGGRERREGEIMHYSVM